MAGSEESVVVYRRNAANCIEMAKELPKPEARLVLLDMAQAWLRLADLAQKFADSSRLVTSELRVLAALSGSNPK